MTEGWTLSAGAGVVLAEGEGAGGGGAGGDAFRVLRTAKISGLFLKKNEEGRENKRRWSLRPRVTPLKTQELVRRRGESKREGGGGDLSYSMLVRVGLKLMASTRA
jgi:hypothetical protein